MTEPQLPAPRIGQVWKDRRNKPTSVFLVTRVWEKEYPATEKRAALPSRTRVTGVLACGEDSVQMARDLDLESMYKMFPCRLYEPPRRWDADEDR